MRQKNWISIGDASPSAMTPVLVTFDNGTERIAQGVAILDEFDTWRWWRFEDKDYTQNPKVSEWIDIVAWMPLPAPYMGTDDTTNTVDVLTGFVYEYIGCMIPDGNSRHDKYVRENISDLGGIARDFVYTLKELAQKHKNAYLASERACGEMAQDMINEIKEILEVEEHEKNNDQ